jgi:hypothetical protein
MTTHDKSEATDSDKKPSVSTKATAPAAPPRLTIPVGAPVRFWRNKRPLTMRDFQEATVVAVGPKSAKVGDEEKGVSVELAEGECWLRVKNATNGRHFLVVSKHSATPEPGAFSLVASA